MKVPLNVGWLSENGLLEKAAAKLGYELSRAGPPTQELFLKHADAGLALKQPQKSSYRLEFTDEMLFTLDQLADLGFDRGNKGESELSKLIEFVKTVAAMKTAKELEEEIEDAEEAEEALSALILAARKLTQEDSEAEVKRQ